MKRLTAIFFTLIILPLQLTAQDWISPDGTIDVELKIMDSQVKSSNPEDKRRLVASIIDGIQNKEFSADSVAVKNILIDLALEPMKTSNTLNLIDVRSDAVIALASIYSPESESALYTIIKNEEDEYLIMLTVSLLSKQTRIYNQALQILVAKRFAPLMYQSNRQAAAMAYIKYVEYLASLEGVFVETEVFSTLLTIMDRYRNKEIQERVLQLSRKISGL